MPCEFYNCITFQINFWKVLPRSLDLRMKKEIGKKKRSLKTLTVSFLACLKELFAVTC